MKKLAASLLALAVVLCGLNAFAAETDQDVYDVYFGSDNSVHFADYNGINGANYTTVLIRDSDTTGADGVVYVDQQSNGFDGIMDFMLKSNVKDGIYTATFGNSKGDATTINFKVGDVVGAGKKGSVKLNQANKMSVADEPISTDGDEEAFVGRKDGHYKKSFTFTAKLDDFDKFDSVYLILADGTGQGEIELYDSGANARPSFSGNGEIALGIQIYNIPESAKGMNLYLGEASK